MNINGGHGMSEYAGAKKRRSALILTLGCRVNHYESEAIAAKLREAGFTVAMSEDASVGGCDTVIVNTCSVTAMSDRKSRQTVHRAIKNNPDAAFYVTGCSAQNHPQAYAGLPGVRAVVGNRSKLEAALLAASDAGTDKPTGTDLSGAPFESMSVSSFGRLRSYIKIEDGCRSNCAYCIIPRLRGDIRCKAPDDVTAEAGALVRGGSPEIVLTGIELSAYSYGLAELIKRLDAIDGIRRIRLGSLDPSFIRADFVDAYAACRHTMPHFHLSMQSGCDRTLAAMRRRYNTAQVLERLQLMRERIPALRLSADIICGFPGESDADFEQTRSFLAEADFFHLHVFPYSRREGTEAADMPNQIPSQTAKERVAALMRDSCERQHREISRLAAEKTAVRLLVERVQTDGDGVVLTGHSEEFFETSVRMTAGEATRLIDKAAPSDDTSVNAEAALPPDSASVNAEAASPSGGTEKTDFRRLRGHELTAYIEGIDGARITARLRQTARGTEAPYHIHKQR